MAPSDATPNNVVTLAGRVSGDPETTVLPSGDEIITFRLVVARPPSTPARPQRQSVDTFDCTAWTSRLRRTVARLSDGDEVQVGGALRRRFSRGAGGVQSFVGVELSSCTRRRPAQ